MVDLLGMFRRRPAKRGAPGFARSRDDITALGDSFGDMLRSPVRDAPPMARSASLPGLELPQPQPDVEPQRAVLDQNARYSKLYQIIGDYADWEHRYDEIVAFSGLAPEALGSMRGEPDALLRAGYKFQDDDAREVIAAALASVACRAWQKVARSGSEVMPANMICSAAARPTPVTTGSPGPQCAALWVCGASQLAFMPPFTSR